MIVIEIDATGMGWWVGVRDGADKESSTDLILSLSKDEPPIRWP